MKFRHLIGLAAAGLFLTGFAHNASAQVYFTVTVDTSQISGVSGYGEFSLSDGTVVDGNGPSTANNIVLSNFGFGGGSAGAVLPPNIGNASGSMTSSITLADGDAGGVADLAQAYTAGSIFSFDVQMSEVPQAGTSDEFLFRLLDNSLNYIGTSDPSGNNALIKVDISTSNIGLTDIKAYAASGANIPKPLVTIRTSPVAGTPEPGTVALFSAAGAAGLVAMRRRRRQS
jgi:hypothetical protein